MGFGSPSCTGYVGMTTCSSQQRTGSDLFAPPIRFEPLPRETSSGENQTRSWRSRRIYRYRNRHPYPCQATDPCVVRDRAANEAGYRDGPLIVLGKAVDVSIFAHAECQTTTGGTYPVLSSGL